jgi:hypothetical protein
MLVWVKPNYVNVLHNHRMNGCQVGATLVPGWCHVVSHRRNELVPGCRVLEQNYSSLMTDNPAQSWLLPPTIFPNTKFLGKSGTLAPFHLCGEKEGWHQPGTNLERWHALV